MLRQIAIERRERRESGFTLIELLVVILIIGVLAAIAIPMFLNQRKAAADASLKADVRNAATAVQSGFTTYPNAQCVRSSLYGDQIRISYFKDDSHNNDDYRPTWSCTGSDLLGHAFAPLSDGNTIRALGITTSDDPDLKVRVEGWNPKSGTATDVAGRRLYFDFDKGGFTEEAQP